MEILMALLISTVIFLSYKIGHNFGWISGFSECARKTLPTLRESSKLLQESSDLLKECGTEIANNKDNKK